MATNFLGSPGGAALVGGGLQALGAGLSAANQSKMSDKDRFFQAQQAQLNRMGPPGSEQAAYAKLALQRALFEGLGAGRDSTSLGAMTVPEEMKSYVPQFGPGINLDPARATMMNRFSDEALQEDKDYKRKMEQAALQQALQGNQEKPKGSGFWKKFGKIASVAAPIVAAPFTGGLSLAAIGAGAGAANAALSGGGLKGAALGAAMGAGSNMLGGKLPKLGGGRLPPMGGGMSGSPYISPKVGTGLF